jgi:rubrerythrin
MATFLKIGSTGSEWYPVTEWRCSGCEPIHEYEFAFATYDNKPPKFCPFCGQDLIPIPGEPNPLRDAGLLP